VHTEAALRPWISVFAHGDFQITHVFDVLRSAFESQG
jgi:hypothetical protein